MARRFNSVLESEEDIDFAIQHLTSRGLPTHPDRPKNWDVELAVEATLQHLPKYEPVLDAGGDKVSNYLPILADLGYMNMVSLNLLHGPGVSHYRFTSYRHGNIEQTEFPSKWFGFIACLSVIEHGVNVAKFLEEASRLLRQGGHLFISTDVWWHDVETNTKEWRVFLPYEISQIIATASRFNLFLTGEMDLKFGDPLVKHEGAEYTFCNLLFRKGD
jgi:hypothetical protein